MTLATACPKPQPRVLRRITDAKARAKLEREVRAAVRRRDHGKCQVPGCKERSAHLHHIRYRSRGGRWLTENLVSLCVSHHRCVHAGLLRIEGNADVHLDFHGRRALLAFGL